MSRDANPVSDKIAEAMRQELSRMSVGERLPTVRQLMAKYGASQFSVQRALSALKSSGLIAAHVGRGTFVGRQCEPDLGTRNVLILTHEHKSDRANEFVRTMHQTFLRSNWRSAILTYSDFGQVIDMISGGPRFDACVVQPRLATLPLRLLAALRARTDAIVVEGYSVVAVDVDCVGILWPAAVGLAMRHLTEQGHRNIGFVTLDQPARAFLETTLQFRELYSWAGLPADPDPVFLVPPGPEEQIFSLLQDEIRGRWGKHHRLGPSALIVYPGVFHGKTLLASFKRANLDVPADVSIVTLGSTDLVHEHVGRLTTVGRSTQAVTEAVKSAIERRWAKPDEPNYIHYLNPELVDRGSTTGLSAGNQAPMLEVG